MSLYFRTFASMKRLVVYMLGLLLLLMGCTTAGEQARMRAGLDSINVLNRTDQPFTMADVQPYLDYFEDHGTSNDQMLAHYLLGLAYYDHGEAPMALKCYQEATELADTTADDCDYKQLSRVYGQMADLFYQQGLYRQELTYDKLAEKFAWKGKDTLATLINIEKQSLAYNRLGIVDSAVYIIEDVARQYNQYGYHADAAIAIGTIIRYLLDKGDYAKAKNYMDQYEAKSGFFDKDGNIEPGREIYYKSKGLYYLNTNTLDSAEYYFRKELHDGRDFNNQNAAAMGLALLFRKQNKNDSSAHYALYGYAMNDSMYTQQATMTIERIQALYNYTRFQETAKKESERASSEKRKKQFIMALSLFILLSAGTIIYKVLADKKKKYVQYLQSLKQLEQIQSEVLLLREHADEYEELIAEKERQFKEQIAEIQEQRRKVLHDHSAIDEYVKSSSIYQQLEEKQYSNKLTTEELRECRKLIIENYPELNTLLLSKQYKLSEKDFDVCILFRLGFKSKEVSNMLDVTQGRISQICSKILKIVFEKDKGGAAELIENLHNLY